MSLRPVCAGRRRVVVRRDPDPDKSKGGIIIPIILRNDHAQLGEVVAVHSGHTSPPEVMPGDRVLFGKYAGTDVEHEGELLTVMPEEEILAVLEG